LKSPVADIILITWNGRQHIMAALAAVAAQLDRGELAGQIVVTVVDNGSVDGTSAAVMSQYPKVRLVSLHSNLGFTGGIAAAARTSVATYLIFLNNDAVPEPGWLEALVEAQKAAPADVVAVGGKIVDLTATRVDFIGGVLTFDGHAFQTGFRKKLGSVEEPADGEEILFACGGNMIVRRKEYLDLGGFDDDYFAYLEDVDFGWRAWLSGFRITYAASAVVRHASSATSNTIGAFERGVLFERNALQTALKNFEGPRLRESAGSIFLAMLHRLHHYVTMRNLDVDELQREPFNGSLQRARRSWWRRLVRGLTGRRRTRAALDDDLTVMQFRAIDWFFRHSEAIMAKRLQVQGGRKRSDREIFERFPLHFVPTYPGDFDLMGSGLFTALRADLPAVDKTLGDIMES
jgi:GT2 family glycosyltransferase